MNVEQAKAYVAKTNPNAVWVVTSTFKDEPDTYDVFDFTYSDEIRAKIFEYDHCTESLFEYPSGREVI